MPMSLRLTVVGSRSPREFFADRWRPLHTDHPVSCQPPESRHAGPAAAAAPADDVREKLQGSAWARFRALLMRLHFYAGIFVSP